MQTTSSWPAPSRVASSTPAVMTTDVRSPDGSPPSSVLASAAASNRRMVSLVGSRDSADASSAGGGSQGVAASSTGAAAPSTGPQVRTVQKVRQVPQIQKVQKMVEVPQIEYVDTQVHVPVVKQVQVPMVQKVQKVVEVPQVQTVDVAIPGSEKLIGATAAKDDGPRSVDRLGHADYAKALVKVVAGPVSCTPVTVGLYADWGSGKSHMMNQLMAEFRAINAANSLIDRLDDSLLAKIDPYELQRPNYVSVWFNTWLYAGSQNLWAGLIAALYDATEGHFGARYCAALRLTNSSYYKYLLWPIILVLLAVSLLIVLSALVSKLHFLDGSPLATLTEYLLESGILKQKDKKLIIATSVVSVLTTVLGSMQFFQTQANNLRKAASSPSWKEKIGHMADVKDELEYIGKLLREGPRWDLVFKRLMYPFAELYDDGDAAISVDGLSSVVDRFQDLQKTVLQDPQLAQANSEAKRCFEKSMTTEWEGLRRRGKQLDTSSVDRKFKAVFQSQPGAPAAPGMPGVPATPLAQEGPGPARTVTVPEGPGGGGGGYMPLSPEESATPLLGWRPTAAEGSPKDQVPWWEGFYVDPAGNLMNLSRTPAMNPTQHTPDPQTIEEQRQAYANSLQTQLEDGLKSLDEQCKLQIAAIKEAARERRLTRIEQDEQQTRLREAVDNQKRALHDAAETQRAALGEQAEQAVRRYFDALRKKRDFDSGAVVPALIKCSTRPWLAGVREVTTIAATRFTWLRGKRTVIRHASSAGYHAKLSRGWHGRGTPRITWETGPMAGETWHKQRNSARGARFVVFVDDLDRCPPAKVAEVLQCIVLLTENTPFVIVLAIDPRLVIKAIEAAYDKSIIAAGMNGYAFLDKVVQLPFAIPHMTIDESQQFVDSFADEEVLKKEEEHRGFAPNYGGGYDPYGGGGMVSRDMLQGQKMELQLQREDWLKRLEEEKQVALGKVAERKEQELAVIERMKTAAKEKVAKRDDFKLVTPQIVSPPFGSLSSDRRGASSGELPTSSEVPVVEEVVDVPVPMIVEEVVHVPMVIQQNREQHVHVEQIVDVPVPMVQEEIVEVPVYVSSQERAVEFDKASAGLLGPEEVGLFRYLTNFLDRNPRRIKRIMNIYAICRELMATRSSSSISQGVDKAMLIKFVILCEQWPYRMSWIIHLLEDFQQMIVGTSQDKLDEAQYNVYCRNVGTFGGSQENIPFPPPLPTQNNPPLPPLPEVPQPYDVDMFASACASEEDLEKRIAQEVANVEKMATGRLLEVEKIAKHTTWQMDNAYQKLLVASEKKLTYEDYMEPVDISELYKFVQYSVYDSSTWEATLNNDASFERRSILSMDSDPELFEALLRTPPAITVDRIGSYRRRDPGKLASYLMNLNPALRSLVAWQAGHRENEGGQYISKFQAHLQKEVEENQQARRLIQRVQAQMGAPSMAAPPMTYAAPVTYGAPPMPPPPGPPMAPQDSRDSVYAAATTYGAPVVTVAAPTYVSPYAGAPAVAAPTYAAAYGPPTYAAGPA